MNLYRQESSDAKHNAQRNLSGRTHYVDEDTLRFHKSRVLSAHETCDGLIFYIITSDALNYQNTRRGFRYVIFDVFGTVLDRPGLEHAYRTSEQAKKAMWAAVNALDPVAHTLKAIERQEKQHAAEMERARETVAGIAQRAAA